MRAWFLAGALLAVGCSKEPDTDCGRVQKKVRAVFSKMTRDLGKSLTKPQLDDMLAAFCEAPPSTPDEKQLFQCILDAKDDTATAACMQIAFTDYASAGAKRAQWNPPAIPVDAAVPVDATAPVVAPDVAVKAVTALVTANVQAVANDNDTDFAATLRADAVQLLPTGQGEMDSFAERFYGRRVDDVKHTLGALTVEVDPAHHVAWFYAPVAVSYAIVYDTGSKAHTARERIAGIALEEGGVWKLAAVYWARAYPFAALEPDAKAAKPGAVKVTGLPAGTEVAGWLAGGLAAHVAPGAAVLFGLDDKSTGTTAADTAKLAAAWDATAIWPQAIEVTQWGTFPIAFARATVEVPGPSGSHYAAALGAILVPDGAGWRWVLVGTTADGDTGL